MPVYKILHTRRTERKKNEKGAETKKKFICFSFFRIRPIQRIKMEYLANDSWLEDEN
jgi:hypothetical protein